MNNFKYVVLSGIMAVNAVAATANAGDNWYVSTTLNGMAGSYSGSDERDDLYAGGLLLNADYLDNFSVALSYNRLRINFKNLGSGKFSIDQDAFAGRLQYHFLADSLNGTVTAQVVLHDISNDDPTKLSDDVSVISPKISYMNAEETLQLGFEYAYSDYSNAGNFSVDQYVPSIGFGFNQNADWVQVKLFYINYSDKNVAQGESSLTSVSARWTHWLAPGAMLGINNFFIDVLAGKRLFAVDNDAMVVYNLADIQKGSAMLGVGWKPAENFDITAIAAYEKYENKFIDNAYEQQYVYLGLTKRW